ncbi:MAG: tripartite tricarboxylate transporter substrate binding protein [Burkholderiales bacterium]|nr:tripartite tricarboxylate transporter substrate binding protein [Burkholderiales bacterium]
MKFSARICASTCFAVALSAFAASAISQPYPARPVKMLVGFSAGGGTDLTARIVAQKLSESIGQPVVVENRPGSGGMIATTAAAKAPSDGYTLLMAAAADTVQPAIRPSLPYDLERDFEPVSLVVTVPFALVTHPSVPARNVKELIALARSRPGVLNYGSSGIGSSAHLSNELFNSMAKIKITHVPYKGVSQGVTALAGGQIDMIFASFPASLPLFTAGKIRMLAVSTAKRTSVMPELPTVNESGLPGYERYGWYGVLAPAKVGKPIIELLNAGIVKAVTNTEVRDSFIKQGLEPVTNTPGEFSRFIHKEIAQTAQFIKAAGAKSF